MNSQLKRAADCGDAFWVGELLANPRVNPNYRFEGGTTALMSACGKGHADVVEKLLGCAEVSIGVVDDQQRTALHHACSGAHDDVVRLLLEHPDVEVNCEDFVGETPFYAAIFSEAYGVMKLLLKRQDLDLNRLNDFYFSPLITGLRACKADSRARGFAKTLLRHKNCDLNFECGDANANPILYVCTTAPFEQGLGNVVRDFLMACTRGGTVVGVHKGKGPQPGKGPPKGKNRQSHGAWVRRHRKFLRRW